MTTDTSNTVTSTTALQTYLNSQAQQIAAQQAVQASGAATSANSTLAQATSAGTIGSNFNTFINILTTQLQNQDPTNATDPNQFTQELVQFAGVEQQLNTNNDLQSLINLQNASSFATGVGYIGNYVEAPSTNDQVQLQGGTTEFNYKLADAASNVTVAVQDSAGNTVASFTGPGNSGSNYVTWNGQTSNGTQEPDGTYTVAVTATDSSGNAVSVSSFDAISKVTSVQSAANNASTTTSSTSGTGLDLFTGNQYVPTSDITAIYTPTSLPTATALTAQSSS